LVNHEASKPLATVRSLMEGELRLLRQAHEEQAKHIVIERVVAADCIRVLELRAEQLEREVADAHAMVADEHEQARRHVEAARAERDRAVGQLEEFQQTRTYRFVMLMRQLLSRGPSRTR
jgi:RecB family exonuclease